MLHNICVLLHDDYEGQRVPANNHRLQYDGDDEVGAKDIRQAIVDYLF